MFFNGESEGGSTLRMIDVALEKFDHSFSYLLDQSSTVVTEDSAVRELGVEMTNNAETRDAIHV